MSSTWLAQAQSVAKAGNARFSGRVCRQGDQYAIVDRIEIDQSTPQPRLCVWLASISNDQNNLQRIREGLFLPLPATPGRLSSSQAFGRFLKENGITLWNDLAVESKATKATMACWQEADWALASLQRIQDMMRGAKDTLAKATGNELLEPSIPQLQEALQTFEQERNRLTQHRGESLLMLRKLHDFLSVPEAIRPILSFDLDELYDPARIQQLEASFEDVVTLNNVFRDLSRDKLC